MSATLVNGAEILLMQGELEDAFQLLYDAQCIAQASTDSLSLTCRVKWDIARLSALKGEYVRAVRNYQDLIEDCRQRFGTQNHRWRTLHCELGDIYRELGIPAKSEDCYRNGLSFTVVFVVVFAGTLAVWVYRFTLHPLAQYPGPKLAACSSLYFMHYIWTVYFSQHCEILFRKYKSDVIRVAPGQIVFNDPRSLKDIVGRSDVYRCNFALRVIGFAGTNVSNIRDPGEHRRKRRLMAPGFSNTALNAQEPGIVVPIVDKLVVRVAESDGTVNLTDYFYCATLDIIGALSFGANFGTLDKLDSHPFLHVLPSVLRYSVIAQCIPEVFQLLSYVNRYGPAWMTPKAFRGVADFAGNHLNLRKRRDATEIDLGSPQDIISIIEAGNEKFKGKEGYTHLGKYEMLGEATNLVTGGGDTVATALTNTFWHLGQNPVVYKRLVSELRSEFASSDSLLSPKIAQKTPYLDAVLNESMRVSPVLPGPMWRHTDNPIPVAGYMVPAHVHWKDYCVDGAEVDCCEVSVEF
ncbi:benzoate 4-monooxygenase cytochrome P450 [Aspergillus terreus]|uniref:Benzoate 4-monooxygenase cytochrome P450 n=1 Tax=Aspergillus terreus TaxID=33178 RepID=A0A5M3Z3S0_ASPTE|nr:hypothetical protein ATETN484_0006065400 [Aspergillus terreus]GFF19282.1 benzoate 4-monooxygenase cytochrome P450 [Aspergillus terreus]